MAYGTRVRVPMNRDRQEADTPLAYIPLKLILTLCGNWSTLPVGNQMKQPRPDKADVLQGTLILLVLRTLEALGPLHGYGIARRIEQISKDLLRLNQGTLYPALLRMEQEGWISSKWGASEKNRKAKFYSITAAGRKRLAKEAEEWRLMSSTIETFLGFDPRSLAGESLG
jgi:PadR family transcriptional regulator, regulatory protein PadR